MDVTTDWFWEGNVVAIITKALEAEGWKIVEAADTRSKAPGIDIHATRNQVTLLVEAKGYPSTKYRDPRRALEQKPTNPTNQAQHWYSHALLKALRLQNKHPKARVAIAFPDFPRYRSLFDETQGGLRMLGIGVIFTRESGTVEEWGIE